MGQRNEKPTEADMRAFGASHIACYKWPDDTPEHRALRAAYIEGAADFGRHATKLEPHMDAKIEDCGQ